MPLCDGTGPLGLRPRTGRGKGRCCTGFNYKSVSNSVLSRKYGWLLGLVLPLGTVILRNLLNPSGVIRRVVHASSTPKITEDAQKTRRLVMAGRKRSAQRKLTEVGYGDISSEEERKIFHENSSCQR